MLPAQPESPRPGPAARHGVMLREQRPVKVEQLDEATGFPSGACNSVIRPKLG